MGGNILSFEVKRLRKTWRQQRKKSFLRFGQKGNKILKLIHTIKEQAN
jgi:hypothetical protein